MGSSPTLGTNYDFEVFHNFYQLSPAKHLGPRMPDGAKVVTLLTRLSFELDHIASRFSEFVYGSFQSLGRAASISARHGLNVMT